jgi:hypothetical protein
MQIGFTVAFSGKKTLLNSFLLSVFTLLFFVLAGSTKSQAIPAFARKYGLPCSACHEAWPMLNVFGQTFKDNGYQLMNDRDSPIWQNPSYWPATFRITPNWHRESTSAVVVDANGGTSNAQTRITTNGFDLTGLDFHTGGTLYQNISFYVLPSSDPTGAFHFETVMARIDNIAKSSWLNFKLGKYELDNLISEKRILTISNNGGVYQLYHFTPPGDNNFYGQMGDNQLGMELMGHSLNDRTRYSVSVLSSNDGNVGLPNRNAYSTFITASQAFDAGYQGGVDRIGGYYFGGVAPTFNIGATSGGVTTPIVGVGNKPFNREGFFGLLYVKKLDFQVFFQHGSDSAFFSSPAGSSAPLPAGYRDPSWNGFFVETHYVWNPQLIFIQRSEIIRMSQQAVPGTDPRMGDVDAFTFGYRWYPIMFSRAGFAWHNEYSLIRQHGTAPLGGNLASSSLMLGFDFDF